MSRSSRRDNDRRFPDLSRISGGVSFPTTNMMAYYNPDLGVTGGTSPTAWANQAPSPPTNSNLVNVGSVAWTASDSEFNNRSTMSFAASAGACFNSAGTWGTSIPLGGTYICVGRLKTAAIGTFAGLFDGPVATNRNGILHDAGSSPPRVMFAGSAAVTSATGNLQTPCIVWAVFNGASSSWGISSKTATGSGNPGTQLNNKLIVGGHALTPGGTNGSEGKMGIFLVYSSLSVSDRNTILDTLAAYYNITVAP